VTESVEGEGEEGKKLIEKLGGGRGIYQYSVRSARRGLTHCLRCRGNAKSGIPE